MKDYHVLSIDGDPMTGTVTDHGCVLRLEDIPWAGRQLWDCDVQVYEQEVPTNAEEQAAGMGFSKKVKKYVMYFPMKDRNDVFHWGTAIADNPAGPFIPQPAPLPGSYSIDMCAFRDDAGPFQCLGRLSFEPRPYQMVPLILALKQERIRLLISDDVGIGKTLESLLIAKELLDRHDEEYQANCTQVW